MKSLPETNKQNGQKERSQKEIKRDGAKNGRYLYNLMHGKKKK